MLGHLARSGSLNVGRVQRHPSGIPDLEVPAAPPLVGLMIGRRLLAAFAPLPEYRPFRKNSVVHDASGGAPLAERRG